VSKPDDSAPGHEQRHVRRLAAVTVAAALVVAAATVVETPLGAIAGVTSATGVATAPNDAPPVAQNKPQGTYQLRCWQYGRLLFDEGPVTLSAESRQAARLVAFDRHGATLIVTDTGGTTCLARPSAAAPNLALPR
jgi:hypothetical protein